MMNNQLSTIEENEIEDVFHNMSVWNETEIPDEERDFFLHLSSSCPSSSVSTSSWEFTNSDSTNSELNLFCEENMPHTDEEIDNIIPSIFNNIDITNDQTEQPIVDISDNDQQLEMVKIDHAYNKEDNEQPLTKWLEENQQQISIQRKKEEEKIEKEKRMKECYPFLPNIYNKEVDLNGKEIDKEFQENIQWYQGKQDLFVASLYNWFKTMYITGDQFMKCNIPANVFIVHLVRTCQDKDNDTHRHLFHWLNLVPRLYPNNVKSIVDFTMIMLINLDSHAYHHYQRTNTNRNYVENFMMQVSKHVEDFKNVLTFEDFKIFKQHAEYMSADKGEDKFVKTINNQASYGITKKFEY